MIAALAFALFGAAQPGITAPQTGTLTKAQVQAMPPGQLTRQLFGDVGQIMFPRPFYESQRVVRFTPSAS